MSTHPDTPVPQPHRSPPTSVACKRRNPDTESIDDDVDIESPPGVVAGRVLIPSLELPPRPSRPEPKRRTLLLSLATAAEVESYVYTHVTVDVFAMDGVAYGARALFDVARAALARLELDARGGSTDHLESLRATLSFVGAYMHCAGAHDNDVARLVVCMIEVATGVAVPTVEEETLCRHCQYFAIRWYRTSPALRYLSRVCDGVQVDAPAWVQPGFPATQPVGVIAYFMAPDVPAGRDGDCSRPDSQMVALGMPTSMSCLPILAEPPVLVDEIEARQLFAAMYALRGTRVVPRVLHAVCDGDRCSPRVTVDRLEGSSLDEYVFAGGPVGATCVLSICAAVAAAVSTLHGRGVAHRDLSACNVYFASHLDCAAPTAVRVILTGLDSALTRDRALRGAVATIAHHPAIVERHGHCAHAGPMLLTRAGGIRQCPPSAQYLEATDPRVAYATEEMYTLALADDVYDMGVLFSLLVQHVADRSPRSLPSLAPLRGLVENMCHTDPAERPPAGDVAAFTVSLLTTALTRQARDIAALWGYVAPAAEGAE